ncbi:MAG: SDR family oxidoreductase [Defluviitaleaceae bacterium]|nr:SDR family oxidoreductase [Defluviitaleaceae bacterium]MCL2264024.1 SDR family oxidoreductase [Defluviitaleaceae bacterium]
MTDVKGKWALITGASRGIGYLAAKFMAERGCNLVLHSRTEEHSAKILGEVKALGVDAYAIAADLADPAQVTNMLKEIDAKNTPIEIVLNNAGVQVAYRTEFYETPISDFTTSFQVNTIAPAMICYHYMPKMVERGFGRIVNTTSGIQLDPQQAGYSASKAALDKFTIDIGTKVQGTDVMINLADPGWCRTDLGGQSAPNPPEAALPGVITGVFVNDKKSGRCFAAGNFMGMTIEQAVAHAESNLNSPY